MSLFQRENVRKKYKECFESLSISCQRVMELISLREMAVQCSQIKRPAMLDHPGRRLA